MFESFFFRIDDENRFGAFFYDFEVIEDVVVVVDSCFFQNNLFFVLQLPVDILFVESYFLFLHDFLNFG